MAEKNAGEATTADYFFNRWIGRFCPIVAASTAVVILISNGFSVL
jgi:hypothetical protein